MRNKINLTRVFTNDGDYLRDALEDEDIPNFWNFGMELTRPLARNETVVHAASSGRGETWTDD